MATAGATGAELGKLRWRCRRGMRELDELLTNYLDVRYPDASPAERAVFAALLDAPDADLHAWCLGLGQPPDPALRDLVERITTRSYAGP